jgi:hypothetical protein
VSKIVEAYDRFEKVKGKPQQQRTKEKKR